MHLLQETRRFLRSEWLAPALHIGLFAITWLTYFLQNAPLFDGPSRWGFNVLFFADLPISVVAFSKFWDGQVLYALSLWGVLGPLGGTSSVLGFGLFSSEKAISVDSSDRLSGIDGPRSEFDISIDIGNG